MLEHFRLLAVSRCRSRSVALSLCRARHVQRRRSLSLSLELDQRFWNKLAGRWGAHADERGRRLGDVRRAL